MRIGYASVVFVLLVGCRGTVATGPAAAGDASKAKSELLPPADAKPRVIFGRTVRVRFQGNREVSEADLRAVMWIDKEAGDRPPLETLKRDVLLLNATYYDRGYLMVTIGDPVVIEAVDGPFLDVIIPITNEGPRLRIGKITISERDADGNPVASLNGLDLRSHITTADGGWFARDVMIRDLAALRTIYRDQGYANIEAEPETEIDVVHKSVDVAIPIRRGPLVRIERITVTGIKRMPKSRIMHEVSVAEGELFNETKLTDSLKRLRELPGVRRADASTEAGSDAGHLLITVEIEEK